MGKWRKTQKGWESCHITKQISREVKERKQNGWGRSDSDAGQIKESLPTLSKSIGQRQHQRSALSFKTEPPFISLLCSDTKQEWPVCRVPQWDLWSVILLMLSVPAGLHGAFSEPKHNPNHYTTLPISPKWGLRGGLARKTQSCG